MIEYRTLLIVGTPGSGKGTLGKVLGSIPRFFHFACGDVFRSLDTRTTIGQKFVEYSSRGELVPDEITIDLWQARIKSAEDAHLFKPDIDRLVLDGIPRNRRQAELMESVLKVERVFHLVIRDEKELYTRLRKRALKENRFDDANDSVIRNRLEVYAQESVPVLEYYGPSRVIDIDAMQPPYKVVHDVLAVLAKDAG